MASRRLLRSDHSLVLSTVLRRLRFLSSSSTATIDAKPSMSGKMQCTDTVLMIRPGCFNYNPKTAVDNRFQVQLKGLTPTQVQERALEEFEGLVSKLRSAKVNVIVEEDTLKVSTDTVFPNNWISFHQDHKIVIYPMKAENRRVEKRYDIVDFWKGKSEAEVVDYSRYEQEGKFLEGTGSMVLDRVNRIAFACKSQRTNIEMVDQFCTDLGYTPVIFSASQIVDGQSYPIYHTNVMLSIGDTFAIVCLDAIRDDAEKGRVLYTLLKCGKCTIIPISEEQMNSFAGNVLQLSSSDGRRLLVMSTRAFNSLSAGQLTAIHQHCSDIVHCSLETIETLGGGGARCMIAEIFPPNRAVAT